MYKHFIKFLWFIYYISIKSLIVRMWPINTYLVLTQQSVGCYLEIIINTELLFFLKDGIICGTRSNNIPNGWKVLGFNVKNVLYKMYHSFFFNLYYYYYPSVTRGKPTWEYSRGVYSYKYQYCRVCQQRKQLAAPHPPPVLLPQQLPWQRFQVTYQLCLQVQQQCHHVVARRLLLILSTKLMWIMTLGS